MCLSTYIGGTCCRISVCCSVLQCVAVCCSVLQCLVVSCSVLQLLQCGAVCCSALQCGAVCCSVLQYVAGNHSTTNLRRCTTWLSCLQCIYTNIFVYAKETYNISKQTKTWKAHVHEQWRWLRFVGSVKLYFSFAKEPYKRDYILQKWPVIVRSVLIAATPQAAFVSGYQCVEVHCSVLQCVAVCCSGLQCVAVGCSVLHCDAVCCSVVPCVARYQYHSVERRQPHCSKWLHESFLIWIYVYIQSRQGNHTVKRKQPRCEALRNVAAFSVLYICI